MADIDESLDKYYDESLDDIDDKSQSKADYSDVSDASVKALKRKLEVLKNNEMDPEEAERQYQEDLKNNREKKQQKQKMKETKKEESEEDIKYDDDFGSDNEDKQKKNQSSNNNKDVEDEYEEKFEVQSNSFSIRSKQSIGSIKEQDDDNNAYTLKQTRNSADLKLSSKTSLPSVKKTPIIPNKVDKKPIQNAAPATKSVQRIASARPPSAKQIQPEKQDPKKPQNAGLGQDKQKLISAIKQIKTPVAMNKKEDTKQQAQPAKLTQHQIDLQNKKKENEESEKKLLKQPKLPNIQSKILKVNNFMKENKDEKKKVEIKNETAELRKPKDELDENIFGEDELEKGDQALAPGDDDNEMESEEAKKLKEKQRRQEILKEQKEKRKEQLGGQWDQVKQILKNHEDKQKELQKKEDQFYIKEAVEKMKQKRVKQNLKFETEESNWVDITRKSHVELEKEEKVKQEDKFRQQMLQNLKTEEENLKKKKVNDQIASKVNSQPKVSTKNEIKEKQWDGNIAPKKGTLNEISKIESEKNEIVRENEYAMQMKQVERKKYLEQLEIEKQLKKKASEFVKEGQDFKNNNKALDNIDKILQEKDKDKKQKEKEKNYQYEVQQKEKNEQDQLEIKKLKVELRQCNEENKKIKSLIEKAKEKQETNKAKISSIRNREGVVVLGENKFTSFGLVPALSKKQQDTNVSTEESDSINVMDKINDQERRQITQLTVIELIVHKITEQGLTLSDIFSLLDYNKDGILTISEIELNMGKLELDLTEEEIQEMIKIIDTNKDGVINEFEFVKNLETQYQSQKEYNRVMGELKDIQNPIVLQERVLDLEVRQRVVLKCMKKEEEKQISKGPDYDKYLQRLKKHEDAFEKRQKLRNKGKDLSNLTAKAAQLKLELKKLEDEKEMILIMQRERMEAIQENISKLTDELMQMSEIVIQAKNVVDKQRNDYQKLVIKQVAIDRLQEQLNEQRRLKEIEQQKQALKFQSNIKQKAKNILYEQQHKMSVQNVVGAAILLQKIYRGWKSRVQAKKRKELLLRAVQFIQTYYWWYIKKKKVRTFVKKIENQFRRRRLLVIKMLQVINYHMQKKPAPRAAFISIRGLLNREEFAFFDQRQVQIQQYVNKNKNKTIPVKEEDVFGQEQSELGDNSSAAQFQQPQYATKIKKDASNIIEDFRAQELPAVMTLQRGIRRFKNNVGFSNNNQVTFTMGGINSICRICNIVPIEILCRSCEQCIFCKNCYERFHKSYHRRNHRFYELNPSVYSSYDTGQNKAQKEEVQKSLNIYLNDLKKLFQMDMNTGYFPLDQIYNFFETRVEAFKNNRSLFSAAQVYALKFVDEKNKAIIQFQKQDIEHKYDSTKQYVDHIKFVRSFYSINKDKQ